jgi:uncharacterized tellurite resistance protein B-like protein
MEPANRIEQYLDFMLFILRADGVVDREEKRHLLSMMVDGMKLHPDLVTKYREALEIGEWPEVTDDQLAAVCEGLDASSLAHLVRDAYSMAASDGEIHEAELALLQRFLGVAGVPPERFSQVDQWARQSLALAHRGTLLLEKPHPSH